MAVALLDDAVHHRKAQAGSLAEALGGEEGFEDLRLDVGRHPHAVVADGEHDILPAADLHVLARIVLVQFVIGRFDQQLAAVGHGVAGVDHEVHDHLFDLAGIGHDAAEVRGQLRRAWRSSPGSGGAASFPFW